MNETVELIKALKESLKNAESLLQTYTEKVGYVVESAIHVHVGKENGLGNTEFDTKSPYNLDKVSVWDTEEAAQEHIDPYLKDMYHNSIPQNVKRMDLYLQERIKEIKESLNVCNEYLKNTTPVSE